VKLLLSLGLTCAVASQGWSESPPQFMTQWGTPPAGRFSFPAGLAASQSGTVYVVEKDNYRVQVFSSNGTPLTMWGAYGFGPGQFELPLAIAKDEVNGFIYVGDHFRMHKFASDGIYLSSWGSLGTGEGQFTFIKDIAVSASGNVYVIDSEASRIQRFDTNGNFQLQWGSWGTGNGQFIDPRGICIGPLGEVYVTEGTNSRVQVFDANGTYLDKWGSAGSGNGQMDYPTGVATDNSGNVYVADVGNCRVQVFDRLGTFLRVWGSPGSGPGQFQGLWGLDIDAAGHVYVCDPVLNRVQRFSLTGLFETQWGMSPVDGELQYPKAVALAPDGSLYVLDSGLSQVKRYTRSGGFLAKWGLAGNGPGEFFSPRGIAVSPTGSVYVADLSRVHRFNADGGFVATWGSQGGGPGQFGSAEAVAVGPSGDVYVADGTRIQRFTANGGFLMEWGAWGTAPGQFVSAIGIQVDVQGSVWVLDAGNNRVQKFTADGNLLGVIPIPSQTSATALAINSQGQIYLSCYFEESIGVLKLAPNGAILAQWGEVGGFPGQFSYPTGIAVDSQWNVFVTDFYTSRVQKFGFSDSPRILLAQDVGNDQGKQIRLGFQRSLHDGQGSTTPILQYVVFRRIDPISTVFPQNPAQKSKTLEARKLAARQAGVETDLAIMDVGWDFVQVLPAFGQPEYNLIAPTLADSTIAEGMHWSVFFVRAATAAPLTYFDSAADSGYSLDNLAPNIPSGFVATVVQGGNVDLHWLPVASADFRYFSLHRGLGTAFTPDSGNLMAQLTGTTYSDLGASGAGWSYKLSATDFSGNRSDFAMATVSATDTDRDDPTLDFAATIASSNPARALIVVRYSIPRSSHVTIQVFDPRGRMVRELMRSADIQPGLYVATWDGRDHSGNEVSTGVYLLSIETEKRRTVLKTTLMR
jgi:tripartite motif-containing protein 71